MKATAMPATNEEERRWLDEVTGTVIRCVHEVSNTFGPGFLERVYENALIVELRLAGLQATQQQQIAINYKNVPVGDYIADIVVEQCVIVEVKALSALTDAHSAQCVNYLKATGMKVCLLVNFGTAKALVKRLVHNF